MVVFVEFITRNLRMRKCQTLYLHKRFGAIRPCNPCMTLGVPSAEADFSLLPDILTENIRHSKVGSHSLAKIFSSQALFAQMFSVQRFRSLSFLCGLFPPNLSLL